MTRTIIFLLLLASCRARYVRTDWHGPAAHAPKIGDTLTVKGRHYIVASVTTP